MPLFATVRCAHATSTCVYIHILFNRNESFRNPETLKHVSDTIVNTHMHTHMHAHTHSHTHTHAHTHTHSRTGLGVEDKVDLDTAIRSARSFYDLALERGGMDVVAPVFLASQYLSLVNASAHYCSQELTDMLLSLSRP